MTGIFMPDKTKDKIVIYQVFTRLFGNENRECVHSGSIRQNGCGKFSNFNINALSAIKRKGITHIWYTGVIEHATTTAYEGIDSNHPAIVKGKAGSPYAIRDYYNVDPDLADNPRCRMEEFESLVKRTHDCGMKVIIDFVPNHVARQYHSGSLPEGAEDLGSGDDKSVSFSPYNNFYYIPQHKLEGQFDMTCGEPEPYCEYPAKVTGNNRFDAHPTVNDWYETVKLNYGIDFQNGGVKHFNPVPDTWHKMLGILLFWAGKKIDGFRCDMAEMVPVEFWQWAIASVKRQYPDIVFIAEVYNPALYHEYICTGGFDYLYDKVGLYDTLKAVTRGEASAAKITNCWQSLGGLDKKMLNFLENHDEQRIASSFYINDPFKAIPAMVVSAAINTNPVMIYFGQEFGEKGMDAEGFSGVDGRTTIYDYWSMDTIRRWTNGGRYDSAALTNDELKLDRFYSALLNICNYEKAISCGMFFDLTYVNLDNPDFDKDRQFAFLRAYGVEVILIVANFKDTEAIVGVNIPKHAFDCFNLPEERHETEGIDLLSGRKIFTPFCSEKKVVAGVSAHSAVMVKFLLTDD